MSDRQRQVFGWIGAAVVSFIPAWVLENVLTQFTVSFHGANTTTYGAPLPVGQGLGSVIFGGPTTFEAVPFAVNVVITWALVFALTRWAGWVAAFGSMIAGVLALAVAVGMGLAFDTFGGFPLPAFNASPLSTSLTLWIDMMLWSFALAAVIRRLRARKALSRVRAT